MEVEGLPHEIPVDVIEEPRIPDIVTYYNITWKITFKLSIYSNSDIGVEIIWWLDEGKTRCNKLSLDDVEAKWLSELDPYQKTNETFCSIVVCFDQKPASSILKLSKKENTEGTTNVRYCGSMNSFNFIRYQHIVEDVLKDINIMAPYFWGNKFVNNSCGRKKDMTCLKHLLYVMGYDFFHKKCMKKCGACDIYYADYERVYIGTVCTVCAPPNGRCRRGYNHTEECVRNERTKRLKLAKKVLENINSNQLAFILYANKLENTKLHHTRKFLAKGVTIDNIIGGSLDYMIDKYSWDECFYPISMEYYRRALASVLNQALNRECCQCGTQNVELYEFPE